jgi:hypothetical protein
MSLDDADEACAQKAAYFKAEAKVNPLVEKILSGGNISCDSVGGTRDPNDFLAGRATFFRAHEILRSNRRLNRPVTIGGSEYPHDEVVKMFARCVPNVKLAHIPWCSFGRLRISLGVAWAMTLVVSHISARGQEADQMLDPFVLYYAGSMTTIAALVYVILKQNRDVRHAAPWNSAMYLDLNADLVRRDSPALAMARKEFVPQQKPLKTPGFYHALARKIESHGFDAELLGRLSGPQEPSTAGVRAMRSA